jgi:hypothetical protein
MRAWVRWLCTGALGPLQVLAEYAEGRRAPTMLASYPLPHG